MNRNTQEVLLENRLKSASIRQKMDKISKQLIPCKNTFDVFALGHGQRLEFGHLHNQHQSIVNPQYKGLGKKARSGLMSSVDLWSTKHFIDVMDQGEFMNKKKKVEDYKHFEKRLRISQKQF